MAKLNLFIATFILVTFSLTLNLFSLTKSEFKLNNTDTTFASITWMDKNQDCKKLIVLREESIKPVQPDVNINYKISPDYMSPSPETQVGKGNIVIYSGEELTGNSDIKGLKLATDYMLDFYCINKKTKKVEKTGSFSFATVTHKPKEQAIHITFVNVRTSTLKIQIKKGSGENRIILIKDGAKPNLPKNGTLYKANAIFGKGDDIDGTGTFVLSTGKAKEVAVTNLQPGTQYYVMVCEYNGENNKINYLTEEVKTNPSSKFTMLAPPKILPPTDITSTSFKAKWEKVIGGEIYVVDLAYDKDFSKMVENYGGVDVGDSDYLLFEELQTNKYYYRVRVVSRKNRSEDSNAMEVILK